MTSSDAAPRKPGRPRSTQARDAILQATLTFLATDGLEGLSIEAVAMRAGVGKTTIYRWWNTKEELVIDALMLLTTSEMPMSDSGDLRTDLLELFLGAQRVAQGTVSGAILRRLLGEVAAHSPLFQTFQRTLFAPRLAMLGNLIERARARGDIRPDAATEDIVELLDGLMVFQIIYHFIFAADEPRTEHMIDLILNGIVAR